MTKLKQVVVIDDDDEDCYLFQVGVRRCDQNISVHRFISGEAFIKSRLWQQEEHDFKMILLEIVLPRESGLEWLKVFLKHECCQNIPVILYSSYGIDPKTCKQAGATDYIVKPYGLEELDQVIDKIWINWLKD